MKNDFPMLYLENQICFPLYAASRLTIQLYTPFLKELELTYPQYLVMLVLWQNNEVSVNEIGSRLLLESNTLTPLLKRLEQKKLIERSRSKEDERVVLVCITDAGNKLKTKAAKIPEKILQSFSDNASISMNDLEVFQKTLKNLLEVLQQKSIQKC